jgi:hypothetical protein
MAQWYAQLVFKDDTLIDEGVADLGEVAGAAPPNGGERYTTIIVSGYALYGQLRGYYSLGVAHLSVDPVRGNAQYVSEQSALHTEPLDTLTSAQRTAIRDWLMNLSLTAWENSTEMFRRALEEGY